MKNSELKNLIKLITRSVLKEYVTMSTSFDQKDSTDPSAPDPTSKPQDAMTSAEKSKMDRENELNRQKNIKQKQSELEFKKKELDANRKRLDQDSRFEIPNLKNDITKLKSS